MTFNVTILGSGSANPTADKHSAAHVLNVREQFYLVDCGEGAQIQMRRYGIHPLKINAIFISHLHGDHVFGLPGLISTLNFQGRKQPLHIFGPAPLGEIIENHKKYFDQHLEYEIVVHEVDTRKHTLIFENKVMEVFSIPLRHTIPATGFLFREKVPPLNVKKYALEKYGLSLAQIVALKRGEDVLLENGERIPNDACTYIPYEPRAYAYCSDTQASGKVASIVAGVDLLYHEATYLESEKALAKTSGHSTALQAAKIAASAGAKQLLLGHFSSRYKDESVFREEAKTLFENVLLAEEGKTFAIPLARHYL